MVLRAEFMLGHSEFNPFLHAMVGEGRNGQEISVLSAMARLGLDPWREAARLAGLKKEAAEASLAETIGRLPDGTWQEADRPTIAARLVGFLPRPRSGPATVAAPDSAPAYKKWLVWGGIAVTLAVYLLNHYPG